MYNIVTHKDMAYKYFSISGLNRIQSNTEFLLPGGIRIRRGLVRASGWSICVGGRLGWVGLDGHGGVPGGRGRLISGFAGFIPPGGFYQEIKLFSGDFSNSGKNLLNFL